MGSDHAPNEYESGSPVPSIWTELAEIKWLLIGSGTLILVLVIGTPFLPSSSSQILAGVLTAVITTFVSVFATYHSSRSSAARTAKEELTRYGLLAWRNLDSLQLKVTQQLQSNGSVNRDTLQEWLLDIDQAKWAWQDILRQVFVLQQRLQVETLELAQDFKKRIQSAVPADRPELEAQREVKLAKLASSAPLPLRIPAEVTCPNCSLPVSISIGQNLGDTVTTRCTNCRRMFHAHRRGDGALFTKKFGAAGTLSSAVEMPSSKASLLPDRLGAAVAAVQGVFADAPNQILRGGWEEFFAKVGAKLQNEGGSPEEARAVQRLLFGRRAFRLLGRETGIGLVVDAKDLPKWVMGEAGGGEPTAPAAAHN